MKILSAWKIFFRNALLFAAFFTATAMPVNAGEVRFSLNRRYALDEYKYDDPLAVRAMLLAGNMIGNATPADDFPVLAARSAAVAREFLAAGMDPDARMFTGETALFFAKDTATARVLIEAGADVNAQNCKCMTPLMVAANGDITGLLLEAGAEVKPKPLPWKCAYAWDAAFDPAPTDETPLHYAPDAKAVRLLLAAGLTADADTKKYGLTPLCWAKNAAVTKALLAAGANPRFKNRDGVTPLHFAPDGESVRLLLEAGADPRAKSRHGFTPLHQVQDAESARLLIAAGADVNAGTAYRTSEEFHANPHLKSPKKWLTPLAVAVLDDDSDGIIGERLPINSTDYSRFEAGEISWNRLRYGALPKETALEIARVLVAAGSKPDLPDDYGRTLLMKTPYVDFMKPLIHAGANVNARDNDGKTPLMHAADEACVAVLLAAGADVRVRDKAGSSALAYARSVAWVKLLMAAGADPLKEWENPLFHVWDVETAAMYLAMLRDAGRDVKALLAQRNAAGRTPLVEAFCKADPKAYYRMRFFDGVTTTLEGGDLVLYSEHGYPLYDEIADTAEFERESAKRDLYELLRLFVPAGADVNAADENGRTVLFHARDPETVRLLLDAGARVDVRDKDGRTPLFGSLHEEAVRTLIRAGADVNARDKEGQTPLHNMYDNETAEALLAAGADVNARDNAGRTPLHNVYDNETAETLLAAGVDVNARDNAGQTPLFKVYDPLVIRTLIRAGADVNARDNDGKTSLFYVYNVSMGQTLLEAGADVNVRDNDGRTPLGGDIYSTELRYFFITAGVKLPNWKTGHWGLDGTEYGEDFDEDFEEEEDDEDETEDDDDTF